MKRSQQPDGWDRLGNGNYLAHGLTSFQAGSPGPGPVFVRLEWTIPSGARRSARSVQLAIPPQQALLIAERLRQTAEHQIALYPEGAA